MDRNFLGSHGGKLRIIGLGEFLVVRELAFRVGEFFPKIEGVPQPAVFAQDRGGALRIGEQIRIGDGFLQFGEAFAAFGDQRRVIHARELMPKCPDAEMKNPPRGVQRHCGGSGA